MAWSFDVFGHTPFFPIDVDPDIPSAIDLIVDPARPDEPGKVIPVAMADSVILVTCPKWQNWSTDDKAQAFVMRPGGDPDDPDRLTASDIVDVGTFPGDIELYLDLAPLNVAAGEDLAFELYVAQGSAISNPYVSNVYRFRIDKQPPGGATLPPPVFADDVVKNGVTPEQLVLDDQGNAYLPATVAPYFRQAAGDALSGYLDGAPNLLAAEVALDGVGQSVCIRFEAAAVELAGDGRHVFTYAIVDRAGNRSTMSAPVDLVVRMKVPEMIIRGGRSRSAPFYYRQPLRLSAHPAQQADEVVWSYAHSSPEVARSFVDTHPHVPLSASLRRGGAVIGSWILRPGNVAGTYNTDPQWDGGCIVRDDGTLYGYGSPDVLPPANAQGVVHVATTRSAYAALLAHGSVTGWGDPLAGGLIPSTVAAQLRDIVGIVASGGAFVALRADGRVVAWGASDRGAQIPPAIAPELEDIVEVVGSDAAFAARTRDGKVFAWGAPWPYGMRVNAAAGAIALVANDHAFAAITARGTVAAWGDTDSGGRIPEPIAPMLEDVVRLAATSQAFAALRRDGTVHAWGLPRFGGQLPGPVTQAMHVLGSTTAFVALSADGTPTCWGEPGEGGTAPVDTTIDVVTCGYGTFAAILADGSAMSWGRNSGRYAGHDAVAVYAPDRHVIVLTAGGMLVSWGEPALDLSSLDGQVSHASPAPPFAMEAPP